VRERKRNQKRKFNFEIIKSLKDSGQKKQYKFVLSHIKKFVNNLFNVFILETLMATGSLCVPPDGMKHGAPLLAIR
jgi:hypothetical protein